MARKLANINKIPKDRTTYTRPEGAGNFDNMDDKNIVDQINIKVGTVDIEPRVDKEIANKKYVDEFLLIVEHGATASTARPSTAGVVQWVGSVAPTNAITGDIWIDTS